MKTEIGAEKAKAFMVSDVITSREVSQAGAVLTYDGGCQMTQGVRLDG